MGKLGDLLHDVKCSFQPSIKNQSDLEIYAKNDIRRAVRSLASLLKLEVQKDLQSCFQFQIKNSSIGYLLDFTRLDRALSAYLKVNINHNKPNGRAKAELGQDGNLHLYFYDFHYMVQTENNNQGVVEKVDGISEDLHLNAPKVQSLRTSLFKSNSKSLRSKASLSRASSSLNQ